MALTDGAVCSVSPEKFKASCRVPLVPGGWNLWSLELSNVDASSPQQYADRVKEAMGFWFSEIPGGSKIWNDNFDTMNVAIVPPGKSPMRTWTRDPDKEPDAEMIQLASYRDPERLTCSSAVIDVKRDYNIPMFRAWVEFVYRGSATSIAWPAFKKEYSWIAGAWITENCPTDSQVCLETAYKFARKVPVPEKPSVIPRLPSIIDPTKSITGVAFWGLVIVGGLWFTASRLADRAESYIP